MKLVKLTDNIGYIENVTNIGCIFTKNGVILIDSGMDDSAAKKIIKIFDGEGLVIKAIINTHAHADHNGGNNLIQERTGAVVYTSEIEESIIRYPLLEPLYLFSGGRPPKDITGKFFMPKPCKVDYVIKAGEYTVNIDGYELNIVPLPGHSFNQIGVETQGIFFCADTLVSEEVLQKYKLPFNTDISKHRETLDFLSNCSYQYYVPSHCSPAGDIKKLVRLNIKWLDDIDNILLDITDTKKTSQQILKWLCDRFGIEITSLGQYSLANTTLMAHLGSLESIGKIKYSLQGNELFWERVN